MGLIAKNERSFDPADKDKEADACGCMGCGWCKSQSVLLLPLFRDALGTLCALEAANMLQSCSRCTTK